MSTRTGISFLTGIVKSDGGSILKSESVAGIVPVILSLTALGLQFEGNLLVLGSLASELNLQIGVNGR